MGLHAVGLIATSVLAAFALSLADTVRTATWICGAVGAVGSVATVVFAAILPRLRIAIPRIVQDVLVGLVMIATSLAVLSHAGVNLSGIIATSAVFTAILGFSLQDVIGNVAGGLALQLDHSIEEDDWIKVGDITGKVTELR